MWYRCVFTRDMASESGAHELLSQSYPSTLESVDEAEAGIVMAAGHAGFDEEDQHRIGMAVRECMVNAVVHGNRYNRNKKVRVHAALGVVKEAESLVVRIADEGEHADLSGTVAAAFFVGDRTRLFVDAAGSQLVVECPARCALQVGQPVRLQVDAKGLLAL